MASWRPTRSGGVTISQYSTIRVRLTFVQLTPPGRDKINTAVNSLRPDRNHLTAVLADQRSRQLIKTDQQAGVHADDPVTSLVVDLCSLLGVASRTIQESRGLMGGSCDHAHTVTVTPPASRLTGQAMGRFNRIKRFDAKFDCKRFREHFFERVVDACKVVITLSSA